MVSVLYGCANGMNTIALAIGIPLMNVVAVGLRFYARRRQDVRFLADDWFALVALIILLGLGADLLVAAVNQVLSCPQPKEELLILAKLGPMVSQAAWAFHLLGVIGIGAVKVSFLWCMRRVFCTGEGGTLFSKVTYTVMGLVYIWTTGCVLAIVLVNVNWGAPNQGDPRNWGVAPATYTTDMFFYIMTVSDVVIDGIIMFLPIFVIWRLNISLERKFAISGIFLLRLLALGASITRMIYTVMFSRWMNDLLKVDPYLTDPNHLLIGANLNTQMIWWTMFEVGFGIFASCITMIQFLLRRQHVEHFVDRTRQLFHLPSKARPRPLATRASSEPQTPSHGQRGSKHGNLYLGDDISVLSAEYMIGSVRPSSVMELGKLEAEGTTILTRPLPTRKSSSATVSVVSEDNLDIDTSSRAELTRIGRAV